MARARRSFEHSARSTASARPRSGETAAPFACADPAASGSVATVTVMLLAAIVLIVATSGAATHVPRRGSPAHPTRRSELSAPLTQSDPDAAGHVRRRGPGQAAAAA